MAFIDVKNKKGTSDKDPPSGYKSWLEFWESKQKIRASKCEVLSCRGRADLGGHVIKSGEGAKEYILPMCYSCNNRTEQEIFRAWEDDLVPVL